MYLVMLYIVLKANFTHTESLFHLFRLISLSSPALQKTREASLLDELREAVGVSEAERLLHKIAEAENPPELPPSLILNLVKGEKTFVVNAIL